MATRRKAVDSGQVIDVLSEGSSDLATRLPDSLSIDVKLPAPVRRKPAHEAAVAIATSTVDPGVVSLGTTSIEAMKMEAAITTPVAGTVKRLAIPKTQQVDAGDLLVEVDPT